jgi:hypothetical protein
MQGRDYLISFDPRRDVVTCTTGDAGPQLSVRYDLPAIGKPELVFSWVDAALSSAAHLDVNGHRAVLVLRQWSDADPTGVRWPLTTHLEEASGRETLVTLIRSVSGAVCPSRPSESCLAPPLSKLVLSWPKKTPVRVPAAFFLDEVFLHVQVGRRSCWGLVDSGATVNVVDTGSPLASAFQPAATANHSTPEPRDPLPLGEIREDVAMGDVVARHFPAASVPIPSFDEFGARRPELLIGHPLFLGAAVRIDFARQRFLLSEDARSLHTTNATAVPVEILGETVVAEGKVDGVAGWFVLDTGDSESLDLFQDWAATHGFPGTRPNYSFRQRSEVGNGEVDEKRMRPTTFELGPIHLTEPLVAIDSVRSPSDRIAGQVGNGVFARCAAVVFDLENRTLWLEPPCNRPVPENLSGWVLGRKDSATHPDSPWVVRFVIPGGSADRAGVKAGDRIVRVGGRAAILEISTFEAVTKRAPRTKVPVVLLREGAPTGASARQELTLELIRPLVH